jgi:hypothetical protein
MEGIRTCGMPDENSTGHTASTAVVNGYGSGEKPATARPMGKRDYSKD